MVIAINTISIFEENKSDYFFHEIFTRLIAEHTSQSFVLIAKNEISEWQHFQNMVHANPGELPKSKLLAQMAFPIKLKKICKKYRADVLIHTQPFKLKTDLPQILFRHDVNFLINPEYCDKKVLSFMKKNAVEIFSNAASIIVASEFEKVILKKLHADFEQKTHVIYEGINSKGTTLETEERERIKEKFAEGNEYFIYPGTISPLKNLVNLLKAFSAFKKRQRSGMQLMIAGGKGKGFDEFLHSVDLYKFKKEVKILTDLSAEKNEKIIAAAYATILPAANEIAATAALQSMQCDVPVIGCSVGAIPEICGDAGSYFAPGDYKNITDKMMLIFKDEKLRSEMIAKGRKNSEKHNWGQSVQSTWKIISENHSEKQKGPHHLRL